jgi:hypothetical protein
MAKSLSRARNGRGQSGAQAAERGAEKGNIIDEESGEKDRDRRDR